ncbi:MAG: TIGR00730 family Rossman fold protein [Tepidisphaerales bacterium]
MIRSVTVFCAASGRVSASFLTCARQTGQAIADAGWTLVYGGNRTGCMHELAEGARSRGGRVVGVTPRLFVERNYHDTAADELVVTDDMRQRKLQMENRGDAFLILPGGLGTYEELFEQLVARQLRFHAKPLVAVDVEGYFAPLRDMLVHGHKLGFIKPAALELLQYVRTPLEAVEAIRRAVVPAAHRTEPPSLGDLSYEASGGR